MRPAWLLPGALGLTLAAVIAWELRVIFDPPELPAALARRPGPPPPMAASPTAGDPAEAWLATALARPLFNQDRRPPAGAGAGSVDAGLPRLAGVLIGPSGNRALLVPAAGSNTVTLKEGERLGAYAVQRIMPGSVMLAGPRGVETLGLSYANGGGADALAGKPAPMPAVPAGEPRPPAGLPGSRGATLPPWMTGGPRPRRRRRHPPAALLLVLLSVTGCKYLPGPEFIQPTERSTANEMAPLPGSGGPIATGRNSGPLPQADPVGAPRTSMGEPPPLNLSAPGAVEYAGGPANITLDFADADIRQVIGQVLGTTLGQNYTIDPAIQGTATLRTARPVTRAEVLPMLQAVLAQQGATMIRSGSGNGAVWRVVPAAAAAGTVNLAPVGAGAGSVSVALRYTSAEELAKVLQPYAGQNSRVIADPGRNALIIAGEAEARDALLGLVRVFDTDLLAGQSYALFPVVAGSVREMASALQDSLRGPNNSALASMLRVVPLERINAVLVVSPQPAYIESARRLFGVVDGARRQHSRNWYVHHLQAGSPNDIAYVLQQAFTPQNVTAQPSPRGGANAPGMRAGLGGGGGGMGGGIGGGGIGGGGGGGLGGGIGGGGIGGGQGISVGGAGALPGGTLGIGPGGGIPLGGGAPPGGAPGAGGNPLLGGLDIAGLGASGGGAAGGDSLRIVPHEQNNALLIHATRTEYGAVMSMLRQLDVQPLQVRIDATIAEVTLNDQLNYGTQFFFRNGGLNAVLAFAAPPVGTLPTVANALSGGLPGFVIGGPGNGNAAAAISALQAVTTVKVLSSPQLMVMDNQTARMQVGNLVPYLSQTAQSTLAPGAPVVNSINYQPTGVILQITPRVNSSGMVTLDVSQEVSDVQGGTTTAGITSPTFLARNVVSRVAVQDGQTIGLAGLIRDASSRGNQGIPWLKDIPILGFFAGEQNNNRARTELIVLITPRVMHDQREARALTEDLQEQLPNAAAVPAALRRVQPTGYADPGRKVRQELRFER